MRVSIPGATRNCYEGVSELNDCIMAAYERLESGAIGGDAQYKAFAIDLVEELLKIILNYQPQMAAGSLVEVTNELIAVSMSSLGDAEKLKTLKERLAIT